MVKSKSSKRRISIRYLRRKYRRYCLITALLAGTIGIIIGTCCGYQLSQFSVKKVATEVEPTNEEAYQLEAPYEFTVQLSDGRVADLKFVCKQVLTPQYYTEHYADQFQLAGNEACVVIMMELLGTSTVQTFDPQEHIGISIETTDGYVLTSYPLKNAEMAGEYDSVLEKGQPTTLYKRYQHDLHREAEYLTLSYMADNEMEKVYFALPAAN